MACSIISLWSRENISSHVKYSSLSILPDDNVDIFNASLLIIYHKFSSLVLSSIAMVSFYILSKRLRLRRKWLSDARLVSVTKTEYDFAVHSL